MILTMDVFEAYESNVRSYCRKFTDTFEKASGSVMVSDSGKEFIDFFAGAGALNYGHNNPSIMRPVIEYMQSGGILHSLDMHTTAKADFISAFEEKILKPRGLDYKIMFCGPTGTNGVEAALKLARKVKNRSNVFAFSGGFHGMTAGSMAVTSNDAIRASAGVPLNNTTFFPYPSRQAEGVDTLKYIESVLADDHSGIDKPAAMILETVQAEGGINVAPVEWLRTLRALCDKYDILMICDDVQVGCCRTGTFFSFERAEIIPDMVVLSKSISGCGFPMALMLMKPELDIWAPGEHNGTFRGFQLAMVGAKAAVDFCTANDMPSVVKEKSEFLRGILENEIVSIDERLKLRGIGLVFGLDFLDFEVPDLAREISLDCYKNGLVIETAGRYGSVLKLLPALTITREQLEAGCEIIKGSIKRALGNQ